MVFFTTEFIPYNFTTKITPWEQQWTPVLYLQGDPPDKQPQLSGSE